MIKTGSDDSKGRSITVVIVSLLSVLVICAVIYQLFVYKCIWWDCAPSRDFSVYDLNLPKEFFPRNSEINPLHPDRGVVTAVDEVITTNRWDSGKAIYNVLRFATEGQATKWYEKEMALVLFTDPLEGLDHFSGILDYRSDIADEYYIGCGYMVYDVRCVFRVRYHEYYILFISSVDNDGMTPDNFLKVMKYIDNKMDELLAWK